MTATTAASAIAASSQRPAAAAAGPHTTKTPAPSIDPTPMPTAPTRPRGREDWA